MQKRGKPKIEYETKVSRKKVLFFVHSLTIGGASSSLVSLLNTIDLSDLQVTLAFFYAESSLLSQIPSSVRQMRVGSPTGLQRKLLWLFGGMFVDAVRTRIYKPGSEQHMSSAQRLMMHLAKHSEVIREPYDVAVAGMEVLSTYYVAYTVLARHKIAWIHTNYGTAKLDRKYDACVYDLFRTVVTVSDECRQSFVSSFPNYVGETLLIENMINEELIKHRSMMMCSDLPARTDKIRIITVARIDYSSKRFDRIIRACVFFRSVGFEFEWFIVGDGSDRKRIERERAEAGLEHVLILLGNKSNPYPYIRNADVFVLLSSYEGKPVSVTEAHVLGCPTVVTSYASARSQVPSEYGKVIRNEDDSIPLDLYNALADKSMIAAWRENLLNFKIDNSKSIETISKALGTHGG